jgi:hypothetical protein
MCTKYFEIGESTVWSRWRISSAHFTTISSLADALRNAAKCDDICLSPCRRNSLTRRDTMIITFVCVVVLVEALYQVEFTAPSMLLPGSVLDFLSTRSEHLNSYLVHATASTQATSSSSDLYSAARIMMPCHAIVSQ